MIRLGDRCKYFNSMVLRPVFFLAPSCQKKGRSFSKGSDSSGESPPGSCSGGIVLLVGFQLPDAVVVVPVGVEDAISTRGYTFVHRSVVK